MSEQATISTTGYDICSAANVLLLPRCREFIPINCNIVILPGTYAKLAPISGLARVGIHVHPTEIHGNFNKSVSVLVSNHSAVSYPVMTGDKIAQFILEKKPAPMCLNKLECHIFE